MNWPKFIKDDGTPSGEWISLVITVLPYPVLIASLFLAWIPLNRVIEVGGLLTAYSVIIWGGYMGKKTMVEFGKLKVSMNGKKKEGDDEIKN
jgi:hypothetical protein